MELTALQAYNIEKALIKNNIIEAVRLYREAVDCDLSTAKTAVDDIQAALKKEKPGYFKDAQPVQSSALVKAGPVKAWLLKPAFLIPFLLVDALIFAAVVYFFMFRDDSPLGQNNAVQKPAVHQPQSIAAEPGKGRPKAEELADDVDTDKFSAAIEQGDSFDSLYQDKLASAAYIRSKSSGQSTSLDNSSIEKQIKTARSLLAARRTAPAGVAPSQIASVASQVQINGVMDEGEWQEATEIVVDTALNTRLYLKTDGEWLFIACDAPAEVSAGGYDQLRVYLHSGLTSMLVNERIHIGRGPGITSIRQTEFSWQGAPPTSDDERWKKYKINDWGIFRYAVGTSSMVSGHRQYEAALNLAEAGLHKGVPFTLYAEVETDPLKDAQGKFVERQYLGELGSVNQPVWLVY